MHPRSQLARNAPNHGEWEDAIRPIVKDLYIDQNKTLNEVVGQIRKNGFLVT